jgi:hypothetical protein
VRVPDASTPPRAGTKQAAQAAAAKKIASQKEEASAPAVPQEAPWRTWKQAQEYFGRIREVVGETAFWRTLERYGAREVADFSRSRDGMIEKAPACFFDLEAQAKKEAA